MDVFLDFDEKTIEKNTEFFKKELKLDFVINLKKFDEKKLKELKEKKQNNKTIYKEYEYKDEKFLVYEGVYFNKNNYEKTKHYGENYIKALDCESLNLKELRTILEKNTYDVIFNFNYKNDKNYTHNPNNAFNEVLTNLLVKKNIFVIFDIKLLDDENKLSTAIFNSKMFKKKVKVLTATLSKNIYECKNYYDLKALNNFLFDEKIAKKNKESYEELTNFIFYNNYSVKIEREKEKKE